MPLTGGVPVAEPEPQAPPQTAAAPAEGQMRPQARPADADQQSAAAATPDPTTEAQAAAPQAQPAADPTPTQAPSGEQRVGDTVASLGDVSRDGFWLETPLVDRVTEGRIFYAGTGKSARVQLRPIDAPENAGSRVSLAAMQRIGAPLTDLPRLEVFSLG